MGMAAVVLLVASPRAYRPAVAAERPPPATDAAVLAGKTIIKGERSGVMSVRLPRPVHFAPFPQPAYQRPRDVLRIEGRGRFVGVMMRRQSAAGKGLLQIVAPGLCVRSGCSPVLDFPDNYYGLAYPYERGPEGQEGASGVLPAGRYHLYLIADGAPATVILRFRGLAGKTVLTPRRPASVRMVKVEPDAQAPSSPPPGSPAKDLIYSGGDTHRFESAGGAFMSAIWKWELSEREANLVGSCDYRGLPPVSPSGTPYQMCDSGPPTLMTTTKETSRSFGPLGALHRYIATLIYFGAHGEGTRSIGGYMNTAGPSLGAHIMLLWVDWVGGPQRRSFRVTCSCQTTGAAGTATEGCIRSIREAVRSSSPSGRSSLPDAPTSATLPSAPPVASLPSRASPRIWCRATTTGSWTSSFAPSKRT